MGFSEIFFCDVSDSVMKILDFDFVLRFTNLESLFCLLNLVMQVLFCCNFHN